MKIHFTYLSILIINLLSPVVAQNIDLVYPKNNQISEPEKIILTWNGDSTFKYYIVEVASNTLFSQSIQSAPYYLTDFVFNLPDNSNKIYYWKVRGIKYDNAEIVSETNSFIHFSPNNISDISCWLDPSFGITADSANGIINWIDKSNNNNDAYQTDATTRPKVIPNIYQSIPAIDFNRLSNQDLIIRYNDNIQSAFSVGFWKGNSTFPNYASMLNLINLGAGVPANLIFTFNVGSTEFFGSGLFENNIYKNSMSNKTMDVSPIVDFKIHHGKATNPRSFGNLEMGRYATFWNGEIDEIILFRRYLLNLESDSIFNYLKHKYFPPINLGKNKLVLNCSTELSVKTPYKSIQWSTGETSPNITISNTGTYWVQTLDFFGNLSIDSVYVNLHCGASLNRIPKDTTICNKDTLFLNSFIDNSFAYRWNGIAGSQIKIYSAGLYTYTIIDKTTGLSYSDTINIKIDSINTRNLIIEQSKSLCGGNKIYLNYLDSSIINFNWNNGGNTNYTNALNSGIYTINVTTTAGCVQSDSILISITGQAPTADFTSSSLCQNAITNFTDLSVPPVGDVISSWKWNFSNNTTATQQNPSTIFTTLGTVSAALKITTNRGCSDSLYKTFTVYKRPKAGFYNLLACSGNPTTFVDTSRAGSGIMSTYFWNFAGLGSSNNTTPVFSFPDVATYNVFHQVTNSYGCTDTITRPVFINPSPISNFSFDSVCVGGSSYTSFRYLPTIQPPFTIDIFNWDFGDGFQNNSVKNPTHTFPVAGVYNVQLYVQASNQCVDTIQKEVRVFEPVNVDFVNSATQCVGKDIQFTDISTSQGLPISNWNWFFAGEGSSSVQNPTHAFNQQGNYVVQFTASNSIGCSGTKQRSIAVSDVPAPNFTFTPSYGLPPLVVNYTNLSPANGSYIWSYGDGTLPVTGYNPPAHSYSGVGTYPIKLISTNYRGCTDSIIKYILVDQAYIDGVMVEVRLIPNGEFYKIQVTITNNSNIEITQMGLSIQLGNGSVIRENWTGSILPSQTTNYTFSGEVKLANENAIPVICASIDNINNQSAENRTDNNTTCKEISIGNFDVISIYPNPANESATFGIMLPRDGKVTILLIDALGQMEYKTSFNGLKGYNNLNVSLLPLNAGVYVAEIIYDNNIVYRKLEKSDKK